MKFRKPKEEDYNGEGDAMLCWTWWIFEIWHDLNYGRYEFRITLCMPMEIHFFIQRIISRFK
jgi:hypothetical protein